LYTGSRRVDFDPFDHSFGERAGVEISVRSEPSTAASDLATATIAEIEEERRLLYVEMTRARDNLHLIVPQRFFAHSPESNGDRHMYASRTRFIPPDILYNFQGCAWPVAAAPAKGQVRPSDPVDIRARLRRM
jgi:DNA helicase-2/ATP-dependent DNA helicase PcrA